MMCSVRVHAFATKLASAHIVTLKKGEWLSLYVISLFAVKNKDYNLKAAW